MVGGGDAGVGVGVGGPDDGEGEAGFAVGGAEEILGGDFVPGVGPEGIVEGRGFVVEVVGGGFLVDGACGDEDVLVGAIGEEVEVAGDVVGVIGDEVDDGVEAAVGGEGGAGGGGVADVGGDDPPSSPARIGACLGAVRRMGVLAAGEEVEVDAGLEGEGGAFGGDKAGAADEEDFHEGLRVVSGQWPVVGGTWCQDFARFGGRRLRCFG